MTDTPNDRSQEGVDRRAKPHWLILWTTKFAPSIAAVLVERFLSNDAASSVGIILNESAANVRSFCLFAAVLFLTNPFKAIGAIVDVFCFLIESTRLFVCASANKIKDSCNKPITPTDEGDSQ